jgi:hypothetical protein
VFVHTPEWLRDRREIRSFFIQEVDVEEARLHGDYEAASFDEDRASDALAVAARFVEAVVKAVDG